MKYIKRFKNVQEREDFFDSKSEYVTSITCDNGCTYVYKGIWDGWYYQWYDETNYLTAITFTRNPEVGEWNPAVGTGAFLDRDFNYSANITDTPISIVSKTTTPGPSKYYEEPVTATTDVKKIKVVDYNDILWFEYIGEFDVYVGEHS